MSEPSSVGGLACARRPVQTKPARACSDKAGGDSGQLYIGMNEAWVVNVRQSVWIVREQRTVPLGFHGAGDQAFQRSCRLLRAKIVPDQAND